MRTHTKTFHIRFTEKEYERLCKHAQKAGLPKTTYIRHMINGVWPKERPPAEYWPLLSEMYRIGNNLNQLTYMAHRLGGIHTKRLEEMYKLFAETLFSIQKTVQWLDTADIPAALERGRQLAEAEQNAKGEELCEATVGGNTQGAKSPWSIRVGNLSN
jgi:hypothetical protein